MMIGYYNVIYISLNSVEELLFIKTQFSNDLMNY